MLALRSLNPNQEQGEKDEMPSLGQTLGRQRFVSGRGPMCRGQREGILPGHYMRLLDHMNYYALPWFPGDLMAVVCELGVAGYPDRAQANALRRLGLTYPRFAPVLEPLVVFLSARNRRGKNDGRLRTGQADERWPEPYRVTLFREGMMAARKYWSLMVLAKRTWAWLFEGELFGHFGAQRESAESPGFFEYLLCCPLAKISRGDMVWKEYVVVLARMVEQHCLCYAYAEHEGVHLFRCLLVLISLAHQGEQRGLVAGICLYLEVLSDVWRSGGATRQLLNLLGLKILGVFPGL